MSKTKTTFDIAIERTLRWEGGYVNHPNDPGGETNFGISKRSYPTVNIKELTLDAAKEIYRKDYWLKEYEELPFLVAIKVFDMAVNMGHQQANRLLQVSTNHILQSQPIAVDGFIGPKTLAAIESIEDTQLLLREIRAQQAKFYATLAINNPARRTFLLGWMRRAVD